MLKSSASSAMWLRGRLERLVDTGNVVVHVVKETAWGEVSTSDEKALVLRALAAATDSH
jgi:hypothetical protein